MIVQLKGKNIWFAILFLFINSVIAQSIRNFGDLEVHTNTQLGFFSSVENDGPLKSSSGLVGFYGNRLLFFSGSFIPDLNDMEIANENGLFLNIPITVNNNVNFIYGNIYSDKNKPFNFLELTADAFYQGHSDFSKVDGYVQSTVNGSHIFPIGDEFYLRPLAVETEEDAILQAAYFFENPRELFSNTDNLEDDLTEISPYEFWMLQGDASVSVTLSWDQRSSIPEFAAQIQNLTIVGYHTETQQWLDMGAVETTGTLTEGFITSEQFIPNEYEVISFGSSMEPKEPIHKLGNYLVTPNGDGINDFLYIPELENYENNELLIFNRYGSKVFEAKNYTNEFGGVYNLNGPVINRNKGLQEGVYFYLVNLPDEKLSFQGFLYIDRE